MTDLLPLLQLSLPTNGLNNDPLPSVFLSMQGIHVMLWFVIQTYQRERGMIGFISKSWRIQELELSQRLALKCIINM